MFSYANHILTITKYRRLLALSDTEVVVSLLESTLTIRGCNLRIIYMEDTELKLQGLVESIGLFHAC